MNREDYPEYEIPAGLVSAEPSPYLTYLELACWDRTRTPYRYVAPYPEDYRGDRLKKLVEAFLWVRHAAGDVPLIITSAYRTPEYNALPSVGGATSSSHCEGRALDIRPTGKLSLRALYDICRAAMQTTSIRGLGFYEAARFIHLDIRPSNVLHFWWGERSHPETRIT